MALTDLQTKTAQAIVQIFETSSVRGEYGQVTLIANDVGHLTYGKAQTTLSSGNLYLLIKDYCDATGADFTRDLKPFLPRLERMDTRLDDDRTLKHHLRNAGDDPVMHQVQDAFFDRVYWEPTLRSADYIKATTALGTAIIYDSRIHGSWHALRDTVIANHGSLTSIGEEAWFAKYVSHRRNWLATNTNPALHSTVYRMDELKALMQAGRWNLALPFTVRGLTISQDTLGGTHRANPRATNEPVSFRLLKLADPQFVGEDVRDLQKALKTKGFALGTDGRFGSGTDTALRAFQSSEGLRSDGIAGALTREALGLLS